MELFKNHKKSGFTLIEVVIAVTIVGFISISVLSMQQALLRTTSDASALLTHLRVMSNFVVDVQKDLLQKLDPPREKIDERTDARLTYSTKKIPPQGIFEKIKDIVAMIFGVSWRGVSGEREETLPFLVYKKDEEKKS